MTMLCRSTPSLVSSFSALVSKKPEFCSHSFARRHYQLTFPLSSACAVPILHTLVFYRYHRRASDENSDRILRLQICISNT